MREKYDLLLEQKDKQLNKMNENYEKMLIQSHKSTSHKGSEGEKTFCEYAETFIDFKGFELIDKHTQGGEGDFHGACVTKAQAVQVSWARRRGLR